MGFFELKNSIFVGNTALWFGGSIGILNSDTNPLPFQTFGNLFENNSALYGPDYGSIAQKLYLLIEKLVFLQAESVDISVGLIDLYNQSVYINTCVLELASYAYHSESNSLLFSDPQKIAFSSFLLQKKALDWMYQIPVRFQYKGSVPVFPNPRELYNLSLYVETRQIGKQFRSLSLNISIQLCPSGYALEADPVSYYRCVPC
jgi:hypothetical protein